MPSSRLRFTTFVVALALAGSLSSEAHAQSRPQGFAVERLYTSAPGGGWVVMDALDMRGELGGAMALTGGYAARPLRVTDGAQHLAVVSDQSFIEFGAAVTLDRWRFYLNLTSPLVIHGQSGAVGGYTFVAPGVDPGSLPDGLSDARLGVDVRLAGAPDGAFRLGAGAQLLVPNGNRDDYDTDGRFRAMGRALFAGDVGHFTYAGHLGVHVRPLDDAPAPGSPRGSEALFGVAAGGRFSLGATGPALVVGPELFGASAFRSLASTEGTALEALLTGRLETMPRPGDRGPQFRMKVGAGAGIDPHFGAPAWRCVFGIEVSARRGDGT